MSAYGSSDSGGARPKRAPGRASPFADRRGGPGNIGGVGFQFDYTVHRILTWLLEHWGDPTGTGVIRCEPRILSQPDSEAPSAEMTLGQHGFDVAITDGAHHPPEYLEVKRTPVPAEVIELLASLRHIPAPDAGEDGRDDLVVGLVAQNATTPFNHLGRLYGYGLEATSDEELAGLVAGAGSTELSAMVDALGDQPWATLRRMAEPVQWTETMLAQQNKQTAHLLAGSAEAGRRLTERLESRVITASKRREALPFNALRAELVDAGLLQQAPTAVAPEDGELAKLFVVLEVCPVPLPKPLLAKALGRTVEEVESLLVDALASRAVVEDGDAWFRVPPPDGDLATEFGQPLLAEVLAVIYAWAKDVKVEAHGQTLNAFALAQLCAESGPEIVADLFRTFDKASKRWGDLDIIWKLAQLSDQALLHVMSKGPMSVEDTARWAKVRAQTYICGQGWVLQRVSELAEAIRFMGEAKEISEEFRDDENHAFTLKCEGRLRRMQAEHLPADDNARAEHLQASVGLLAQAEVAFDALIPDDSRFVTDCGESVSLLARTTATKPDFDEALATAARAEELLATKTGDKAYADLKILQAELFMRATDPAAAGYEEERVRHHEVLTDLLARHDTGGRHGPGSGGDRGASEVVARLHLTLGWLQERTDVDAARASYQAAAQVYERLNYRPGLEDALWRDRLMSGDVVPAGLRAALDAIDAEPGVCLLALDRAAQMSTGGAGTARIGSASPTNTFSTEEWNNIVSEEKARHRATRPRWTDGRTSA